MSVLLEIQQQLAIADERVLSLERALAEHPELPSIVANLKAAVRIQSKLRAQFSEAASRCGFDICRYRAFDEHDRPKAAAALGAVADFQKLVSVVYGALKYGYKTRATVTEEVAKETALDFGYAFTGSLGIVLTSRDERLLFDESVMDDSLGAIFSMAAAKSPDEVRALAQNIGPGPVNALYEWAEGNADNGLGADIEWHRRGRTRALFVQPQELSRLRKTIDETSSEVRIEVSYVGILTMADATKNRFKFKPDAMHEIKGTVAADAISEQHEARVPRKYSVTLVKTTTMKYSTGTEKTRWHLIRLAEPPPRKHSGHDVKVTH